MSKRTRVKVLTLDASGDASDLIGVGPCTLASVEVESGLGQASTASIVITSGDQLILDVAVTDIVDEVLRIGRPANDDSGLALPILVSFALTLPISIVITGGTAAEVVTVRVELSY